MRAPQVSYLPAVHEPVPVPFCVPLRSERGFARGFGRFCRLDRREASFSRHFFSGRPSIGEGVEFDFLAREVLVLAVLVSALERGETEGRG